MEAVKQVRIKAVVSGRVQGVNYRASCRARAGALNLVGWVRNRADGAVELEAQGSSEAVDALMAWCRQGPPAARVRDVAVDPIDAIAGERGFEVR